MIIQSVLEFAAVLSVLWGIFNEEKVARWERKVFRRIKNNFLIKKQIVLKIPKIIAINPK